MDKIIFTKDEGITLPQLEFQMPVGYKLYSPTTVPIGTFLPSEVDFGVTIFSMMPATVIFTPAIQSGDFTIVNPIQMIAPQVGTRLKIGIINPHQGKPPWSMYEGRLVATLQVIQTYQVNLLELTNQEFNNYV